MPMAGTGSSASLGEKIFRVPGRNPSLSTGEGTNTYVVGKRHPVLIDTGAGVAGYGHLLATLVREAGLAPIAEILLTHGHPDHVGGVPDVLRLFPGARVWKMPSGPAEDPPFPVRPLADGAVVAADGLGLRAVSTPGHAADHACFFLEATGELFCGDLLAGTGTIVIPEGDGDLAAYMASLERLLSLDMRRIYPAHGPVIEDPRAKITEYLDHRRMREAQILEGLRAGLERVPDLVARIYADVPVALHHLAAQSVRAHLVKLEREGQVARMTRGREEAFRPATP